MRFDDVYEQFSVELFEKFEGVRRTKEFTADPERVRNVPFYGKGGKNIKLADSSDEITKQQVELYKQVFDELSKRDKFDYEELMKTARQVFASSGQNSTTANYNAKRFANIIGDSLASIEAEEDTTATSKDREQGEGKNDTSKFDTVAGEISNRLDSGKPEEGFFTIAVKDVESLKEKMKNLFNRENFERTDAYGILNTLRTEPDGFFDYKKLVARLEEDGELTGTLTEKRVKEIIKKLIQDNIITSSDTGAEAGEDKGVPALDASDVEDDFANPNIGSHKAERLTSLTGQGYYKKPGFGGHNPFKDRELE